MVNEANEHMRDASAASERDAFGRLTEPVEDLDKLAVAFAAIAEPSAPPPGLRAQLLTRVTAVPVITHAIEPVPGIQFLLRANGEWSEIGVPGVQMKYLQVDSTRRYMRTLVRMASGARFPPHRHQDREETLLLEGDLRIDGQDMLPRGLLRSPGRHGARHAEYRTRRTVSRNGVPGRPARQCRRTCGGTCGKPPWRLTPNHCLPIIPRPLFAVSPWLRSSAG